jgi:signal transduction histidine kinase
LTNVLKHSGTFRALVRVVADATDIRVTIRDHGGGFDPATIEGRYGIANSIKGRLTEIGGSATISSRSGGGTRVDLSVPR